MAKCSKCHAKCKVTMPKCSKYHAKCKIVTMPKCSKYHAKRQILVPNCCKYKANGTRKESKKKPNPEPKKKQKLFWTLMIVGKYIINQRILFRFSSFRHTQIRIDISWMVRCIDPALSKSYSSPDWCLGFTIHDVSCKNNILQPSNVFDCINIYIYISSMT